MDRKLYQKRNITELQQQGYLDPHIAGITTGELDRASIIAAELAYRDQQIDMLASMLQLKNAGIQAALNYFHAELPDMDVGFIESALTAEGFDAMLVLECAIISANIAAGDTLSVAIEDYREDPDSLVIEMDEALKQLDPGIATPAGVVQVNPHFNQLSPAELERIMIIMEEASEVIQAGCKIGRHGYESHHPERTTTNRQDLEREVGDLHAAANKMMSAGDINRNAVVEAGAQKAGSINRYLHHTL